LPDGSEAGDRTHGSPTRIQTVILGLDGLTLDTETPDYLSWQETYARYGLSLERGTWARAVDNSVAPLRERGADVAAVREARHRCLVILLVSASSGVAPDRSASRAPRQA